MSKTNKKPRKKPGSKPRCDIAPNLKGGFLTHHHPPNQKRSYGVNERRTILKWRAMELRIQGQGVREIAKTLEFEFELAEPPKFPTINDWLDEAFAEAMSAKQMDADRHCTLILSRTERLLSGLWPIALGQFKVERTKRVDGESIRVIDEHVIDEQLRAIAEIRRISETQAKLLKIGRIGEQESPQLSGQNMLVLINNLVAQNIILPGQKVPEGEGMTLELSSGDADIDAMDAKAL